MISPIKKTKQLISNFKNGNERSVKIKKNIFFSFILRGLSFLFNLLLVPITINYLNSDRYGIWLTLSSIIGWFMLFDLGLGNGLRNKLAESIAKKNFTLGRIYVSTSFAILILIISCILLIFFIVNYFINWSHVLDVPAEMAKELSLVAVFVFGFFGIQFVLRLISSIFMADQKPVINDLLNVLANILSLVIIYLLSIYTNNSLLLVAITFSSAPVFIFIIAYFVIFRYKYKYLKPSRKFVNFHYAKDLMSVGLQFFIIQIACLVIYSTSNVIILRTLGADQVTVYNISFKYFSIVSLSFSIIVAPLWSAITEAFVKNDYSWIKSVIKRMMQIWMISVAVTIIMIFTADYFYKIWIGKEIKIPSLLNYTSGLYVIISNFGSIFMMFLNGIGKLRIQLIGILFSSIIFIPLAIFLSKILGVSGIMLAGSIVIFIYVFLAPIQYNKIITKSASGMWNL